MARLLKTLRFDMWVVIAEMLGALALLLFIVWWTMFSGRRRGEREAALQAAQDQCKADASARANSGTGDSNQCASSVTPK
jgi:ABC-type transporter Mla subunit MlaD